MNLVVTFRAFFFFSLFGLHWLCAEPVITSNASLKNVVKRAVTRGTEALVKMQNPEGYWSTADHPAVTGLALAALQSTEPEGVQKEAVRKGYTFLEKCL